MARKKLKTRKSVTKRFKITATGKILHRPQSQSHFNAKQSGNTKRRKRRLVPVAKSDAKALRRLIPYL
ncbi:MAG: 50S ribosomal protein L35 [Candidatus Spechtbacteria bacterium SB0662_bin_43]|uniref:Large ribosomal subunit protein bL35 n=1 Tax=Candidatus Spechtbacteria bacterium SB0662_bin_43 TaxID=2604897 RepID=A0A845DAR6_9BACT|nr:50S ribosomal protein L35 [Candidatus Spechtbacteria bacterium SB0662_bin_43]